MPKVDKRAKLAQLAALRKAGKKTFDSYEVERVEELYEEVDEDRYKKIVRERLNQDDFVVDDNGEGYADDGREDWDRIQQYESDSEDDLPIRGKENKKCEYLALFYTRDRPLILEPQPKSNARRINPSETQPTGTSASSSPRAPQKLSRNPRYARYQTLGDSQTCF